LAGLSAGAPRGGLSISLLAVSLSGGSDVMGEASVGMEDREARDTVVPREGIRGGGFARPPPPPPHRRLLDEGGWRPRRPG
jgi:hypothetical protein